MLANIIEISQKIYQVDLHFKVAVSRVLFVHLTRALFFSRGVFKTP